MINKIYSHNISIHKLFGLLLLNLALLVFILPMHDLYLGKKIGPIEQSMFGVGAFGIVLTILFLFRVNSARVALSFLLHLVVLFVLFSSVYWMFQSPRIEDLIVVGALSSFVIVDACIAIFVLHSSTVKNVFTADPASLHNSWGGR